MMMNFQWEGPGNGYPKPGVLTNLVATTFPQQMDNHRPFRMKHVPSRVYSGGAQNMSGKQQSEVHAGVRNPGSEFGQGNSGQ